MKPVLKKTLSTLILLFLIGTSAAIFGLAAAYLYLSPNLPSVESIRDVRLQTPLRIYSSDNKLIGEFGEKRRHPVTLDEVPQAFIDALLAAEDAEFYSHRGVSIRGLARAVTELITTGEKGSGGSTLTMQLTRNVFLTLDQKFVRKFNEILLSLKLERELTKDEILELYVNYMFLGKRAYGIQAASRVYYGKDLNELSLAQLAMIAGLFQGPSTQNPIINPTRAIERRNWILGRMYDLSLIDKNAYQLAILEPVTASYHGSQLDISAPYVAELAREKTIRSFGLEAYTEGYRVYTTVNSKMQLAAQQAVVDGLLTYDARKGYRGPEQNLAGQLGQLTPATDTENSEDTAPENPAAFDEQTTARLLELLQDIPDYAGLLPAVVTKVGEQSLTAITKQGEQVTLGWEQGLSSARAYINQNARGPSPESASDIAGLFDVIRVRLNQEGQWVLTQLPEAQAALVALAPNNGAILSLVGGFDFFESHFNRATQAYRQPGSNLKPFIYAAALEKGMTAATLINDAPIVFEDAALEATWRPENDGGRFYGPMRLRRALYLSRNLVSIRILQQIGIEHARETLQRFGFNAETLPRDLTLALGSSSATPVDLATAWAAFANGGYKVSPYLIDRVEDVDGNIIYESFPDTVCIECDEAKSSPTEVNQDLTEAAVDPAFDPKLFSVPVILKRELAILEPGDYPRAPKVLDDQVVFIMDSILKDVIQRGTGTRAKVLKRSDLAGKTGTTNGPMDAWFSGYSNSIVTTTWVGYDQNLELGNREYGGTAALPIWIDFMSVALEGTREQHKRQPPGIVTVKINPETGQRARIDDPDAVFEYFRADNTPELEPSNEETIHDNPSEIFSDGLF